jgi:hypothetical protein
MLEDRRGRNFDGRIFCRYLDLLCNVVDRIHFSQRMPGTITGTQKN